MDDNMLAAYIMGQNDNNNRGGGLFGGDGDGLIAGLLIAGFFTGGFGGFGGFGGGYGGGAGAYGAGAEMQRGFDTQAILSKLDGLTGGVSSLGYDQLAQMNGINQNITQTGYQIQNAAQANAVAAMQQFNSLEGDIKDCCCKNDANVAQLRYDSATNTCAITTAIKDAVRDIIQNSNDNYRALHDENVQAQLAAKDAKIAEQASLIQALNLAQSQANQNQYFHNEIQAMADRLDPRAVPSYPACGPNGYNTPNGYNGYNGYYGRDCRDCA